MYKNLQKNWIIYLPLTIYIILVAITIFHHEPWADEAQHWLMVRDIPFVDLLLNQLRYVGHPGLWHLVLLPAVKLNFPYISLNIISALLVASGVFIFLKYSPLPKTIKLLFPFSFYILYQYSVISRGYALFPLIFFITAKFFNERISKPYRFILPILLLANISAHGFIIAVSFFLLYLIELYKEWPDLDEKTRSANIKASIIFGVLILLEILQLWPPSDRIMHKTTTFMIHDPEINKWRLLWSILTGFISGNTYLSAIILAISLIWFHKRKVLSYFILPLTVLLCFFLTVVYKFWHEGIVFLLWMFTMWLSFDDSGKGALPAKDRTTGILRTAVIVSLSISLLSHISWSYSSLKNEFNYTYSTGKIIAEYIQDNDLEDKKIEATGYFSVAILPYFDKVIFQNQVRPNVPYLHLWLRPEDRNILSGETPDLLILRDIYGKKMIDPGPQYKLIRNAYGYFFFKDKVLEGVNYKIFRKKS